MPLHAVVCRYIPSRSHLPKTRTHPSPIPLDPPVTTTTLSLYLSVPCWGRGSDAMTVSAEQNTTGQKQAKHALATAQPIARSLRRERPLPTSRDNSACYAVPSCGIFWNHRHVDFEGSGELALLAVRSRQVRALLFTFCSVDEGVGTLPMFPGSAPAMFTNTPLFSINNQNDIVAYGL